MSTHGYDSKPFGMRQFNPSPLNAQLFSIRDRVEDKAGKVQMEDTVLPCLV